MSGKPDGKPDRAEQYYVKRPADVDISGLQEIVVDDEHDRFFDGMWFWKLKDGHDVRMRYKSTTCYNGAVLFLVTSFLPWKVQVEDPIQAGRLVVKQQQHEDGYYYDHNYIRPIAPTEAG